MSVFFSLITKQILFSFMAEGGRRAYCGKFMFFWACESVYCISIYARLLFDEVKMMCSALCRVSCVCTKWLLMRFRYNRKCNEIKWTRWFV